MTSWQKTSEECRFRLLGIFQHGLNFKAASIYLQDGILTAERIGYVLRAFRIIAPLAVHQKTVTMMPDQA